MLGDDEDQVVSSLTGNIHSREHQRLGIRVAIHGIAEYLAEITRANGGGRELCFVGIDPATGIVVVRSQHVDRSRKSGRGGHGKNSGTTCGCAPGWCGGYKSAQFVVCRSDYSGKSHDEMAKQVIGQIPK